MIQSFDAPQVPSVSYGGRELLSEEPLPIQPAATARGLALEAELLRIVQAFEAAGIPVIVLKGVPLTRRLHGNIGARSMVDNDLLVHSKDVNTATSVLRELGYQDRAERTLEVSRAFSFQHPMSRRHAVLGHAFAELHWSAFTPELFDVPECLQWQRTERMLIGNVSVLVFDKTMTLVHLAAHLAQHYLREWRIVDDIRAAWQRWSDAIDPNDLRELATATSTRNVLAWVFATLETAAPPGLATLRTTLFARIVTPDWILALGHAHQYAAMLATVAMVSPRRMPYWLARNAFPPMEQLALIYPSTPHRWLWVHYVTRPARPLKRILEPKGPSGG